MKLIETECNEICYKKIIPKITYGAKGLQVWIVICGWFTIHTLDNQRWFEVKQTQKR